MNQPRCVLARVLWLIPFAAAWSSFAQPVANQAASRTDLKSVPEGNYQVTLEVEGQIRRMNLQVQGNRAKCVDSSDPKLGDIQGEFEPRENGVFLAFLQGMDFRASQIWVFRPDGSAAIREVPDRGEQQTAVPTKGGRLEPTDDEKIKRKERFLQEQLEKRFAREAETRRTAYDPIFRDLGLSQDQVNTVMAQLDSLLRGAVKAGDPMQELMIARADFRRAMKAMLGEVRFARYEAFELAKPYRREAGYIQEFAVQKQTPMDPKFNNRLVELLQEFRLDTTETWDGPYDPAPRPLVGTEPIVASIDERTNRISTGLPKFKSKASAEFPAGLVKVVDDYYAMKLQEFAESRIAVSMTPEERQARMQRLTEEIRAKAGAKPEKRSPDL